LTALTATERLLHILQGIRLEEDRLPTWIVSYSRFITPGRLLYWRTRGFRFPKVLVNSFLNNHAKTLPGRTPTIKKPHLCPPLSGELFRRWSYPLHQLTP